jgi:hypothetical protein
MVKEPAEAFRDLFCSFIDTPVDGTGARCMVKTHMDDSSKAAAQALKQRKISEGNFDWLDQVVQYNRMHKAHLSKQSKQQFQSGHLSKVQKKQERKERQEHQRKEDGNELEDPSRENLDVDKWPDWNWKEWHCFLQHFRQNCVAKGLSIKCNMSRSMASKLDKMVSEARQAKGEGWNPSKTFLFEVLTHKNQMVSVPLVDREDVARLFVAEFDGLEGG